jgi:hypothetical protein
MYDRVLCEWWVSHYQTDGQLHQCFAVRGTDCDSDPALGVGQGEASPHMIRPCGGEADFSSAKANDNRWNEVIVPTQLSPPLGWHARLCASLDLQ